MYLTVNNLCFYSYILGVETKIIIPWTDVVDLGISNSILFPDSIKVVTRDKTEVIKCSNYVINLVQVIKISIFPITNCISYQNDLYLLMSSVYTYLSKVFILVYLQ